MILMFRVVSGLGIGISVPSVTLYIAETVSPTYRGTIGCLPAVFHAGGVLISYITGAFLPWHLVSYISCVPGLVLVVSMVMLPESLVHLLNQGHTEAALDSLQWLHATNSDHARSVSNYSIVISILDHSS